MQRFALAAIIGFIAVPAHSQEETWLRSAKSGPWSEASTWQGGVVPPAGAKVHIQTGHTVIYDVDAAAVLRTVNVSGTLGFARDKNTTLNVGLLRIAGGEPCEEGFDCDAHLMDPAPGEKRAALEVGTPEAPIPAPFTARIRLTYVAGDKESLPALVCCGGRMDLHGAPLSRTWVRLGATAKKGASVVTLSGNVTGWKKGDRIILTATEADRSGFGSYREGREGQTEERIVQEIERDGDVTRLTLDRPLEHDHLGDGDYRGAVANLSRNVIVESADPKGIRGHTMYHRGSAGAISYAELRHLGKENVLGRYAIHYHLCGNTMRGSYVLGASIWDSHNRWITIHGTNYLVVRDCVGYKSVGHGFFLEDGTEILNVLDRNLAVQAFRGKKLAKQVLPFDQNDGAGFWWANSLNTFTGNMTCENDRYGYRYEATPTSAMKLTLPVLQPDGKRKVVDIRTLPFVRCEDNEATCDGLYGFNLGEGVNRVGPDQQRPFVIRNLKVWETHYAFRPQTPNLLVENLTIHRSVYGVYHPNYDRHVYRNVTISETSTEPFNRGHDDLSVQYGTLAVDGLRFVNLRQNSTPMIQLSDDNPSGVAETHIRNLKLENNHPKRPVIDTGAGPKPKPKTPTSVPIYLHDYFGPGLHAKVARVTSEHLKSDGIDYVSQSPLTGRDVRVAQVKDVTFPTLLEPVDDLPPSTVITHVLPGSGKLVVRGTAADNGTITKVTVNGRPATALRPNFAEWQIELDAAVRTLQAHAEDAAGNVETTPHQR